MKPDASQGKSPAQASVTVCAAPQKPTDPILKILNEVQEGLTNIGKDANLQAEKLRIVEGFLRNPILETNSPGQEPLRYLA